MPPAARHEVLLLVRENCAACDEAAADIARICTELDARWSATDVDTDRELSFEYGDRVPVILVDGVEHGCWGVDEDRLRSVLIR